MTRRSADSGFTLVEATVVIAMVGLISAVLAAVFTTVIRTSPANEERLDDASSLLGLTTWIPQDVSSASETSFITGSESPGSGCTSGVDAGSQNLLELRWTELGTTYVANYRFVPEGTGTGVIKRFSCVLNGAATSSRMTAQLRTIPSTASPAPSEYPAPVNITRVLKDPVTPTPGVYRGVRFEVIVLAADGVTTRSLLTLDAETQNVPTTLPPSTTVVGTTTSSTTLPPNQAPIAADLFIQVQLDIRLDDVQLPVTDVDTPPASLSATVVTWSPELDVDVDPAGTTRVRVRAELPGAAEGGTYQFTYQVSDGSLTSNTATVTVVVDSTGVPGTTTTTTTSSTTTTVPCTVVINSVTPGSVGLRPNDKIDQDVVVSITPNGSCGALALTFDPDTTDSNTTPQQLNFNAGTVVTIDKNTNTWKQAGARPWTFDLTVRVGSNGPALATAPLVVLA
jgi:hypothetical protein